jgi:hypothetical protein
MAGAKRTIVKRVIVGTPIRSVRQSGSDLNFAGDSGTDTVAVGTAQVLTFTGTDPVQTAVTNNTVTISLDTATGQRTGIAKFDSDHFSVDVTGNVRLNVLDSSDQVTHSLIPNTDSALDLGSATNKWRKLYLSGQTIQLGTIALEESDGGFAVKTASGDPAALSLAGNTTTDLTEGDNLYYTRARFDSALGDTLSTGTIRGYIQVLDQGGDGSLSYDSATGNITYTGPSATEVRAHFQAIDAGGDGTFTYDSATGTFTYTGLSVSQARGYFQVLDQGGDGSLSYDSATGNFTYTGPSATEVRAHLVSGTGVIYDSANGVISIGQDVSTISNVTFNNITAQNDVYISGNLTVQGSQTYVNSTIVTINDKNIVLADSAVNGADIDEGGITLGGALFTGVAPTFTYGLANDRWETNKNLNVGGAGNISADSATFNTITRSNATTIAGTYGSSSVVPVLTVDASGFIDSIGSTTIGGLSSVTWDSATDKLTIGATDGSTYIAIINGFNHLEADSASFNTINVGTAYNISQLSVDSAHIGIIDNDTARINSLQADSASVTNISGTSANYSTLNATTGTISQLDVDSAHIQTLNTHTLSRSNTTVTAGTYGSASLVPVVTVDASGFVDSIGTISVAGVSSVSWDSATTTFTINTADGGSYPTIINGFGILQADSAIATNISGVSLNYGTGHISQLTVDSATITSFQADSATIGEIQFQLGWADSHIGFREGALWYDPFHKNLNYYTDFDHPIEIGMQMVERVYNNTGVEIAKGKPLYYSGNYINDSGQESPLVALADATDAAKYNVQGLSAEAIPNGSYGQIIVAGVVDKIDTSSLNAGDNVFLGLTPGALQNAAPAYPNYPMCIGWVIKSDPNNGKVIINQQNHSVPSFRVQNGSHIGGDLVIDGNLTVVGTQTITSTANVEIGGNFQYLNAGDTIGEAGTTFVGTGLDDAFFSGHYSGDSATKSFFVKIDATGTPDTFEWGFDSAVGTEATGVAITGAAQILDSAYGIEIDFGATTGHTLGDKWTGTATATDIDTGFFSNRNDSAYTHVGLYFDTSENKWTFLNRYDPEPDAPIDPNAAGTQYGVVKATTFEGGLSGNVTGNVTGSLTGNADTATTLATGRNFSASGDATAPNVSFNGSAPVDLVLTLATVNSNVGSFGSSSAVPAITVNAKGLVTAVTATNIDHDALTNFVADEHIDHTSVSITAGTGLTGGGTIAATRDLSIDSAELLAYYESSLRHDNLSGFVADEHIAHSGVSITAGTGLTGGGDITSTRDLAIDSAELNAYFGGSGKGFDADTLDGQEGTYYRINVYDAAGSLLN